MTDQDRRTFTANPEVAGVPREVTQGFLSCCQQTHAFLVEQGVAENTPESERHTMRLVAKKLADVTFTSEDGSRWYLVTGKDAPALQ